MELAGVVAGPTSTLIQHTGIDFRQIPILNLVTALVDKLPVNADAKVLLGGLQDLAKLGVKGILRCVIDALPVDVSLRIVLLSTSSAVYF
jgi:hypothetical protein